MKMTQWFLLSALLTAGLSVCVMGEDKPAHTNSTTHKPPPGSSVTNRVVASSLPVVGYLEGRGQTIIIKAGPKGAVYTVTRGGKTILEDFTLEQIRAQAPELHDFLRTAVAGGPNKSGIYLDASMSLPRTSTPGVR